MPTQVNTDYPGLPASIAPAFNAADFSATLSMTWTVASGDVACLRYAILGKVMWLWLNVSTTTVGGTVAGANLTFRIPGGYKAASAQTFNALAAPGAGALEGVAVAAAAGSDLLTILRYAANWVLGSDNTAVAFSICLEIQ